MLTFLLGLTNMVSTSPARAEMRELQREAVREVGLSMALAKSMSSKELREAIQSVRWARICARDAAILARGKARKVIKSRSEALVPSLARFVIPKL